MMFEVAVKMELVTCDECGIVFAVSEQYMIHRAIAGKAVHCPNGHENIWPNAAKMNPSREELQREIVSLKERIAELVAQAEKSEATMAAESKPAVTPATEATNG